MSRPRPLGDPPGASSASAAARRAPSASAPSAPASAAPSAPLPRGAALVSLVLRLLPSPPESLTLAELGERFLAANGVRHSACAGGVSLRKWLQGHEQHFTLQGQNVMRAATAAADNTPTHTSSGGSSAAVAGQSTATSSSSGSSSSGSAVAGSGASAPSSAASPAPTPASSQLVALVQSLLPADGARVAYTELGARFKRAAGCVFKKHPAAGGADLQSWLQRHADQFALHDEGQAAAAVSRRQPAQATVKASTQTPTAVASPVKQPQTKQASSMKAAAAAAASSGPVPSSLVKAAGAGAPAPSHSAVATPLRPPIPHSSHASPAAAPKNVAPKFPVTAPTAQPAPAPQPARVVQLPAKQTQPPAQQVNKPAPVAAPTPLPKPTPVPTPGPAAAPKPAMPSAVPSPLPAATSALPAASAPAANPAKSAWKPMQPAATSASHYAQSASSSYRPPPNYNNGRGSAAKVHPRLNRAINEITAAYQSAQHAAGRYPGPIEHVYEHIIAHEEFLDAAAQAGCHPPAASAQGGPSRWTVGAFVQLCFRSDGHGKAVLDLPSLLAELLDLLDSVSLLLEGAAATPVETLWDVAAEMPPLLNEKCQSVVMVDANSGKEYRRSNRFERYGWNFRSYADLRLGRAESHPLARRIFNVPADLVAVPRFTKKDLLDFTAGWMPKGPTQKLFQSGAISEEKLLAALRTDSAVRAKVKAAIPSATAAPSAAERVRRRLATFSHAHPLRPIDPSSARFSENWACILCEADGDQGDEARFICEELRCGVDAHSKCVARCPLLLKHLSGDERQQLERLYGPAPISLSAGPASPLDRYLCVHIGSKFHSSIGMLKRIRGLAFDFQDKYQSDLQPKLEAETMRRCDERVQLLYARLAKQLQPTDHLYRECGKKVRDLLMQLEEEEDVQAAEPAQLAQAAAELGIAADASVTLQRSLLRRSHRIQSLRRLLEIRLGLVDARGVVLVTQHPQAVLFRLLASSAPLLVDLVSERLHFVSDPDVLRRAEKKRREDIAAAGGIDPHEHEEEEKEEEKEEERKRASASSRSSNAKGKTKSKAALPVFAERDGGETHADDDDDDLFDDPVVDPYSEGGVRAHMHQLASHPPTNGQPSSPSMLNQIRQLQAHIWRAYCDLHSDCDVTDPPSLLEWLESRSALQADVEAWAAKRAGLLDAKHSASHGDAGQHQQRQLVPVYSSAEITHLLALCVQALQSSALWSEWAAEAAKAPAASSRATSSGHDSGAIDVIRSVPAARRRVMRALQLHFGVSEAEQLGRGSFDQLLDLAATPAANVPARARGTVHIIPAVQVLAASRDEHLPAITLLPAHRPTLRPADESRDRTSALHADAMELQRCALASLVRVPMLSDAAAATHWSLSFEPAFGHIETFVRTYSSELLEAAAEEAGGKATGVLLLHVTAGSLIRLDPAATTDTLMRSSHSGAHCALQLVSLLAKGADGLDQADVRSVADALHMLLADVLGAASADEGVSTAAAFLLDLLVAIPQSLLRLCADLVLPVAAAIMFPEQSNASDSLYAALLQQATSSAASSSSSAAHVSLLHQLGLAMRVPAWTRHFMEWSADRAHSTAVTAEAAGSKPTEQIIAAPISEDAASSSVAADSAVLDIADHAASQLPSDSPAAAIPSDASNSIPAATSSTALVASDSISGSISESGLSPRAVIASIRKARGLDESYLSTRSAETSVVDAEKNALLHSALELLSVELYQSRVHFIAECIQNSEDNNYVSPSRGGPQVPALIFRLTPTDLYLVNNESGFEERNVRSICDLGGSSKKVAVRMAGEAADESRGLIGHKGIGFKSVYVITTQPQIFSNGYAFQLGVEESAGDAPDERRVHNVGMLCPAWIEDAAVPPAVPLLKERHAAQTVIRLPLKAELHKHRAATGGAAAAVMAAAPGSADGWHELRQQFIQIFEPNLLLFLRQVRLLSLEQASTNDARRPPATTSLRRLPSTADAPDIVEIVETHCTPADVADGVAGRSSTHRFLLVQRSFPIPEARRKELRWQSAPSHTQIALAFPLAPPGAIAQSYPLPLQPVFAFLPVRPYGFHFLLQADFLLPSSRDTLSESAPRNRWLMERLPTLMPHALAAWKQHLRRGTPGVNLLDFYHTLPFSAVSATSGRGAADTEFGPFRPAAVDMMRALEKLECVLRDQVEGDGQKGDHAAGAWVKPSAVLSSPHALVRAWLPSSVLERQLHRSWLHPSLQALPDGLKAAIGLEEFDAPRLVDLIRLECRAFQQSQQAAAGGKHKAAGGKKVKHQQAKDEKAERCRLRLEAKANKRKLKTAVTAGPAAAAAVTDANADGSSPSSGDGVEEAAADGGQSLSVGAEAAAAPSAVAEPSAQAQQADALPEAAEENEKIDVEDPEESDEEEEEEEEEDWQTEFGSSDATGAAAAADPVQLARAPAHRNFLCRALLALQLLLQGHPDRDALLNKLRMLPACCPLSDGSFAPFGAPDAQRAGAAASPVLMREWAPRDQEASSARQNGAASSVHAPSKAPVTPWQSILEAPLRLLHAQLFDDAAALEGTSAGSSSSSSSSRLPASSARIHSLRKLLLELGVEPVDDHRVLQSAVNRVRDIGTRGQTDPRVLQLPATRHYCHASLLFAQQHLAACTLPVCAVLRRDLASCALVECVAGAGVVGSAAGGLLRLEDVRSRLLLGPEYSATRLSSSLVALRQACPAHFSFLTLHPCYLQAAVQQQQQATSAPSGGSRQALIAQCRQQWLEFLVSDLRIKELWPLTLRGEAMCASKLRADPRAAQWPEAFQRALSDDGDVLLMDFCAPQLEQLFAFVSSLPAGSSHARLAHALLDDLFNHFAASWAEQGEPFAQLRLRTNVNDFDSALRERDIRISAPSSFVSLLRDAAWIPMSRVRVAAPLLPAPGQRSAAAPPAHRALYSSAALYLHTPHNTRLLPLDTPFLLCPPEQEQSAFLRALQIEAEISAARLHRLLTAEWSQQPGGFRSSLMRMANVYQFLKQHGNERVEGQSAEQNGGNGGDSGPKLSAQQLRYGRRLPDSADIDDDSNSELIRDLFDEKCNERPVVWHPLPAHYGGAEADPRTEQLGHFFAPSQFVLYDSEPETLNVVKEHAEWYRMPAPLPVMLLKQSYRDSKGKSVLFGEVNHCKTPYLERLTRALAHWAQLVHQQQQQTNASTRSAHSARLSADGPSALMSAEECAALLCRWRHYVSKDLLGSNYANRADMREERGRTTALLQTSRMFPCFRSGEDGARVHLCTLQDRPILNDEPLLCERFLASAAAGDSSAPPLHFLIFADLKRDALSTDCRPHESTDALAWSEYGLRRLSEVCERRLLVEEEAAAGGAGRGDRDQTELQALLQRLVRCMQRFLYNVHPAAHASLQAGDTARTLRSYSVVCCARLAVEWVVEGVASEAEAQRVLHDAEAQRVLVHGRDLKMSAVSTLQQIVGVICRLVCDGIPEASRPAQMQEQLAEFAHALLPHRHQPKEMSKVAEQQCAQALPHDEPLWNFCGAALSSAGGGAEPQQARRVLVDSSAGGFNSASVFGKNAPVLAPAPAAALSGGGMPPSADSVEEDQRPTFTAAFPAAASPSAADADPAAQSDCTSEGASGGDRSRTAADGDSASVSARSAPASSSEPRVPSSSPSALPPSEVGQPRDADAPGSAAANPPARATHGQHDGAVSSPLAAHDDSAPSRPAPSSHSATGGADGAAGERRAQPHGAASNMASAAPGSADADPVFDALVESAGGFSAELASARAGAPASSEEPLPVAVREWLHQAVAPARSAVPSLPGVSAAAAAPVPPNATGSELAALMAGWSARFLPAGVGASSSGSVAAGCPSAESLLLIGRWGEALVYQTLLQREAERRAADPSAAPRAVCWVNRDGESGLPYDLTVTAGAGGDAGGGGADADAARPSQLFIEVKSSVQRVSAAFDISAREVSCALQRLGAYEIFRVTGAGSAQAQIHRIANPARAWHRKQLRVFMEI